MKTTTSYRVLTTLLLALLCVGAFTIHTPAAAGDALAWKYQYDNRGRVTKSVNPAGQATVFTYTPASDEPVQSIAKTPAEGPTITWRFDADGRLDAMTDGEGDVAYRWDELGRLASVKRRNGPAISYGYDTAGRLAEQRVGDFYRIAWTYDFLGRLATMDTPAGLVRYDYSTGQGMVVRALPNGIKTFWKRQANGQLEEITHGFFKKPNDKTYTLLSEYKYSHGPDGRIAAISEQSGQGKFIRKYSYDNMGRLTDATGAGGRAFHYEYDLMGNRKKATATGRPDQICAYDWAGRLTTVDGIPCQYDASGNLAEVTLDGVSRQYRYQTDGRLAEARVTNEAVQYRYDGLGRLVVRKGAKGETRFIPDPRSDYWQPLIMEESGGILTLVIWDGPAPLALVRNRQVEWLLHDNLGSVRVVTDIRGNVSRYVEYDPFGVGQTNQQTLGLLPGFSGLFSDPHASASITSARGFLLGLGRFLQPDPRKDIPFVSERRQSLYGYCDHDPVNFIDLNGAEAISLKTMQGQWNAFWNDRMVWGEAFLRDFYNVGTERDDVIRQVVNNAMRMAQGDVTRADQIIRDWRYDNWRRDPKIHAYSEDFKGAVVPTASEWQIVENYMYARKAVETGRSHDMFNGVLDIPRGTPAALSMLVQIPLWSAAHNVGENYHLGPNTFLAGDWRGNTQVGRWENFGHPDNRWERQTDMTIPWQLKGTWDGLVAATKKGVGEFRESLTRFVQSPLETDFSRPITSVASSKGGGGGGGGWGGGGGGWGGGSGGWGGGGGGWGGGDGGWGGGDGSLRSSSSISQMTPSTVGGVYLGGAGGTIDGLGTLKGIRTDANGNLVLVGEDAGDINLPPLRLDDLVTVFHSVYLHGEGPTVTIDPSPENPEKAPMTIVHSEATKDTYVGWVLYEADRLMKGYTLGVDNITTNDVVSRVPGYAGVQDAIYFGAADPRKSQKEGIWERFWIVPAEARRFEGTRRELTLFDVPLKVKTQKMKWQENKLVDDLTGQSSPGAQVFTAWFTTNYNGIAAEQYLVPPAESGITNPVPVFTELRQIALMTAIAEKLRDQGVPMPFWMRDYEVRKVPFEHTTPGLEVKRTRTDGDTIRQARIFGGVELSPETKAVRTYTTPADVAKAPPEVRAEVDRSVKLADDLERAVTRAIPPAASVPLTVHRITNKEHDYRAMPVPGAKTMALDPCRVFEMDLAVPVSGGHDLQLARSFNSFFAPKGPWGRGWTMDLPRLQEIRVPVSRQGGKTSYKIAYELLTPLSAYYARFKDVAPVQEVGGAKLQVPDAVGPFYGLAYLRADFLKNATNHVLLLKDGREWHFSEQGDLVAAKDGPQVTVYERGSDGRVTRIVALLGGAPAAAIALEYNSQDTVAKAVGTSLENPKQKAVEVSYSFDPAGRLSGATFAEGALGYGYTNGLVSSVTWTDQKSGASPVILRQLTYNDRGQVMSEKCGDRVVPHSIAATPGGLESSLGDGVGAPGKISTRFDSQMRPIMAQDADGTQTAWNYKPDGSVETTVTSPDQQKTTVTDSADGRQRTINAHGAPAVVAQFDAGGHLTQLTESNRVVLAQEWRSDGQLARLRNSFQGASFQYGKDGVLSNILVHPAGARAKLTEWQNFQVDRRGNPVEITDDSGLRLQLAYDTSGCLRSVVQKAKGGDQSLRIDRDDEGRVRAINTSWGDTLYDYTTNSLLGRIEVKRDGKSAAVELTDGRVRKVADFDGAITTFDYHDQGDLLGDLRGIQCANGLGLEYGYNAEGGLATVAVGENRRVKIEYDAQGNIATYAWEPLPAKTN